MDSVDLDKLWSDPANWKYGIYRCRQDPRVVVPKRVKWMGWTVNFARPSAIPTILLIMAGVLAPFWILPRLGVYSAAAYLGVLAAVLVGVIVLCSHLSSTRR